MNEPKKRYYLAGPMSGIPQFNFPLFDAVTAGLREAGWDVVSPAELDDPETRAAALASPDGSPTSTNRTWGDFLSRDVKIVADQVQGVLLLPHWEKSRGARLEAFVALLCGHTIKACNLVQNSKGQLLGLIVEEVDLDDVRRAIAGVTDDN